MFYGEYNIQKARIKQKTLLSIENQNVDNLRKV